MALIEEGLFYLIRLALGANGYSCSSFKIETAEEWFLLYSLATKVSMVGVAYAGVCKLPKDRQPPLELVFEWASEAEAIRGHNRKVNAEAARLTELFASQGRRSAILKGAANARLYSDPFIRQCGDIDIWVDGGRESVITLLQKLNLMDSSNLQSKSGKKTYEERYADAKRKLAVSEHHVHLKQAAAAVPIEVHFKPSSGNINYFTNKRLMPFLERAIENVELVPEGFYVPSLKFALAMQFSHIQRHFFQSGIGFKQVLDYYVLLQNATEDDRADFARNLKRFGFWRLAGALMWVLGHVLGLERERMLCPPNERLGRRMLKFILNGGNFGFHSSFRSKSVFVRWMGYRWRSFQQCPFSIVEVFWSEFFWWQNFFHVLPIRIGLRKLRIWDLYKN